MDTLIKILCLFLLNSFLFAQSPFDQKKDLFTEPRHYIIRYSSDVVDLDGRINETAWEKADWSEQFVDIEGNTRPTPQYRTRTKMLWNDSAVFIAAELDEPDVWATLKQHDEIIYHDNDFEVFIDPDNNTHQYYEVEVNAFNTILDLFLQKPYRNDGRADIKWNLAGLKSAVYVNGTLNNPNDKDKGWTIEMSIPFSAMKYKETSLPQEGSIWRINFSRVEWDIEKKDGKYARKVDSKGKPLPEHNWVWSPQGLIDMHYPERWGYLVFTKRNPKENDFKIPFSEKQRQYLWLIYYKQQDYYKVKNQYATTLKELALENFDDFRKSITLASDGRVFTATIDIGNGLVSNINEEGLMTHSKTTE